jgi:hypothetical protein
LVRTTCCGRTSRAASRVDEHACRLDVIAAHPLLDAVPEGRPVVDAGDGLLDLK